MVQIYTTKKTVHQFSIGYMINPSLHIKKMQSIKMFLTENNTSVMALIMIYNTDGISIKKLFRVLSCVIYTLLDNYFCIDYLTFQ